MEEKVQKQDEVAQAGIGLTQKLKKLTEALYDKERLKRFYVAVTKSKIKVSVAMIKSGQAEAALEEEDKKEQAKGAVREGEMMAVYM